MQYSRRKILATGAIGVGTVVGASMLPKFAQGQQSGGGNAETVSQIAVQDPPSMPEGIINAVASSLPDGAVFSDDQASASFSQLGSAVLLAKSAAINQGVNVNAVITYADGTTSPAFNWTTTTWSEFVAQEMDIYQIVETLAISSPEPSVPQSAWGFILSKILVALGLKKMYSSFLSVLNDLAAGLLGQIGAAIKDRAWSTLRGLLAQLIDLITSTEFLDLLGQQVGIDVAKKVIGEILADSLPLVGWAVLIGQFVVAVAAQYVKLFTNSTILEPQIG